MTTQDRWLQVDRILERALDLVGDEREALLVEACAGDPSLRKEVEVLLAIDAAPNPLLDHPDWPSLGTHQPARDDARGKRLGLYRIEELLGEGGMGTVYLAARDDGHYERGVAIKVLKEGMLTRESLGRFRNECRILARLEHQGIARLYDAGSTPEGLPYLVMEHVEGTSLDRFIAACEWSLDERLILFRQICEAVSHAHQHLIVHRDLKPSNILVTAEGKPKLLDFGIAKVVDRSASRRHPDWTVEKAPMTPRYASPEQAAGSEVTTATDVYALGLILAELLTGTVPAGEPDETPSSTWLAELLDRKVPGSLPADLRSIVLRATARSPGNRYRSAEQLSVEIDRFRSGLPVMARKPTRRYRLNRFIGRHRLGVTLTVGFIVLVSAAAVGFALLARELARQRDRAQIESEISSQVTDFMVELFAQTEPANRGGTEPTADQMLRRGAERIGSAFAESADSAQVRSALLEAIGRAYHALSRYDQAKSVLEENLAIARAGFTPGDPALAQPLLRLAETESARSDLDRAEALAREALSLLPPGAAERSTALRVLGEVLTRKGDLEAAEPLLLAASAMDRKLFGEASEQAGASQHALAALASERRDAVGSQVHLLKALEAFRKTLGPEHPRTLEVLGELAIALQNQGKLVQAEKVYRDLLERQVNVFGDRHALVAETLNSIGTTYYDRGDFASAERELRKSLAMLRDLASEPTLEIAGVLNNLARVLRESGRTAEAVSLYREALGFFRHRLDPGSPSLGSPLTFLGGALCTDGDVAEGERLLDEARAIYLDTFGPDHYRLALLDATRSRCLARRGRLAEAIALLQGAKGVVEAHFGADHRIFAKISNEIERLETSP